MLTPIDQIASKNHLQLMKAAVSYLPPGKQKYLAVFLKVMEIQNLLRYFHTASSAVTACSSSSGQTGLLDILTDLKQYCSGSEQDMLEQWIQMFSMIELYSMFAGNMDPEQLINHAMSQSFSSVKEPDHESESLDK